MTTPPASAPVQSAVVNPGRLGQAASALLAALWLAQLAYLLTRWPWLARLSVGLLVPFLALALAQASRRVRLLFAAVWAGCCVIAFGQGRPAVLWAGLEQAMVFGAFLPSLLLLRATAQGSPYTSILRERSAQLRPGQAVHGTLMGAHLLGSVLSVGAMGVLALGQSSGVRDGMREGMRDGMRESCAAAAVRGMATSVMWSPFFVAMAFCSQLVPAAPLAQVMLTGAGLATIGLALSVRLFTPGLSWREGLDAMRPLAALSGPLALMFAAVLSLNALGLPGLHAVSLALPAVCGAYLATRGREATRRALQATVSHFSRLSDEMLIVVGATLLGSCIAALPAVQELAHGMRPGVVPGSLLLGLLVGGLYGLGQLGVHPMIGAGLVLPVLATGPFGAHPVTLVSAAVFAWGLSSASSIWTLPFATASAAFGVPIGRLWNAQVMRFALLLGLLGVVYLGALNAWLTRAV